MRAGCKNEGRRVKMKSGNLERGTGSENEGQ